MTNKAFTEYYFQRFTKVNLITGLVLILTGLILPQGDYIIFIYLVMSIAMCIYARIQFELQRGYAGIGGTLLVIFLTRLALAPALRNRVGVFDQLTDQQVNLYISFVTSNEAIILFAWIGVTATFFLILDMYLGVKKMGLGNPQPALD